MPAQIPIGDQLKAVINAARVQILDNCAELIEESAEGFRAERFPRSCFLAMTAIEEAGTRPGVPDDAASGSMGPRSIAGLVRNGRHFQIPKVAR
jgi:hypothetical protein